MKVRICISLPAKTVSDMVSMTRRAEDAGADFIEIRFDYAEPDVLKNIGSLEKVVEETHVPLIATNRQHEQGGYRLQDEEQRIKVLLEATAAGFQYIDIELTALKLRPTIEKIKECGAKPIVSFHNFADTPVAAEMEKTIKAQIDAGAEVCKLTTTANDIADNVRCLLVTQKMSRKTKLVCFAMGRKGTISRVLSPLFGAYFTFASLGDNMETAPGQLSIDDLRDLYKRLGVD